MRSAAFMTTLLVISFPVPFVAGAGESYSYEEATTECWVRGSGPVPAACDLLARATFTMGTCNFDACEVDWLAHAEGSGGIGGSTTIFFAGPIGWGGFTACNDGSLVTSTTDICDSAGVSEITMAANWCHRFGIHASYSDLAGLRARIPTRSFDICRDGSGTGSIADASDFVLPATDPGATFEWNEENGGDSFTGTVGVAEGSCNARGCAVAASVRVVRQADIADGVVAPTDAQPGTVQVGMFVPSAQPQTSEFLSLCTGHLTCQGAGSVVASIAPGTCGRVELFATGVSISTGPLYLLCIRGDLIPLLVPLPAADVPPEASTRTHFEMDACELGSACVGSARSEGTLATSAGLCGIAACIVAVDGSSAGSTVNGASLLFSDSGSIFATVCASGVGANTCSATLMMGIPVRASGCNRLTLSGSGGLERIDLCRDPAGVPSFIDPSTLTLPPMTTTASYEREVREDLGTAASDPIRSLGSRSCNSGNLLTNVAPVGCRDRLGFTLGVIGSSCVTSGCAIGFDATGSTEGVAGDVAYHVRVNTLGEVSQRGADACNGTNSCSGRAILDIDVEPGACGLIRIAGNGRTFISAEYTLCRDGAGSPSIALSFENPP